MGVITPDIKLARLTARRGPLFLGRDLIIGGDYVETAFEASVCVYSCFPHGHFDLTDWPLTAPED